MLNTKPKNKSVRPHAIRRTASFNGLTTEIRKTNIEKNAVAVTASNNVEEIILHAKACQFTVVQSRKIEE